MPTLPPSSSELAAWRTVLSEHLPFSPLDYVPGMSLAGDRQVFAEQLTAPLPEGDELRFATPLPGGGPVAVFAQRLAWDSRFFGYGVARLDGVFPLEAPFLHFEADYTPAVEQLLERARQHAVRYLFAVVDPRDVALLRALGGLGFALIETRIHYHLGVQIVHYVRTPDHLPQGFMGFRLARREDIPSLSEVARQAVNPYDRFHADPFIARADVDRLMETWVEQSVIGQFADLTVVPDVAEPRAMITYRLHQQHWARWGVNLVQVVLSVVAPEALGWFAVVGPELGRHLRSQGAQHCYGKTQITLGLDSSMQFGRGEHVLRIVL